MSITFETKLSKKIQGLRIITPSVFEESRGSIWTSYNSEQLETYLPEGLFFKHDKFSCSKHNVLRGIHGDNKSWKLVSCISGSIMQVVVDMRPSSSTYLAHECFDLGSHNHQMILIPPKLGNAFYVYSESAIYHYKLAYQGDYADYDHPFTVAWNDPRLKINWPTLNPILSERDSRL